MQAPIISFVAKGTNSGKTYLMEKLVGEFKARGKKVTAVKHGTHRMDVDKEGKDRALLLYELKEPDLDHLVSLAREGSDIVLVEGFKSGPFKKIEVFNPALYDTPLCLEEPGDDYIAIVSGEYTDANLPWFSFEDVRGICDFIEGQCGQ